MISELEYVAMEMTYDILRLTRDKNNNIYIITNHENRYTAPYKIAYASSELYDDRMRVYKLNDVEINWLKSITSFVKNLEIMEST